MDAPLESRALENWSEKHKPRQLSGIAGQGKAIEEIKAWMAGRWKGTAVLLYGPTGCGKTLLVEALAAENGLTLMQMNASDERGADEIAHFAQSATTRPLFGGGKAMLLDEVDGISGQDRGAVSAIADLIKASQFPVFLIANDPWSVKLRPLRPHVKMIGLHKVPIPSIARRLREICEQEGIRPDEDALKSLARWAQGDMRSAINDLQTIAQGRKQLAAGDMDMLGFRERESSVFEILPTLLKSRSIAAGRNAIRNADKDADEIFWWMENNLHLEFREPGQLAMAYETLARADMFRSLVVNQQNWRFKGFMVDIMAGVSLAKDASGSDGMESHAGDQEHHGFTPYQPPRRFTELAATRKSRADMESACTKIGMLAHCSQATVVREYLPYMRLITRKRKGFADELGLDADEAKAVK